jgi:hypothetical protein
MDGFRTKTGRCVFEDGEVRLEPDVRTALLGYDRVAVALGAAALVGLAGLGIATGMAPSTIVAGLVFGAVLSSLGMAVNVYREHDRISTIPLEQIQYVTVREGRLATLAPRFVIKRDSREGAAVRFVMMHSIRFASGREEFERGKELFRRHGLELRGTLPEDEAEASADGRDAETGDERDAGEPDATDDERTFEDVVGDVPESDVQAGLDYERYQRTRGEDEDDDSPAPFDPDGGDDR